MYISMTLENVDVLQYYGDSMHPEIARRFESLVDAESELEKAQGNLENAEFSLSGLQDDVADKASDLEYIISDELPTVLDGSTKAERAEAMAKVVESFNETIQQLRDAIASSQKGSN